MLKLVQEYVDFFTIFLCGGRQILVSIRNKGGEKKGNQRFLAQRSDRRKAQTASTSPMAHAETTVGSAWKESA